MGYFNKNIQICQIKDPFYLLGNSIKNSIYSSSLFTAIFPLWSSIISLVIDKPKPDPPVLVVLDSSTR